MRNVCLALIFALTLPASARVLSYAPYTSTPAFDTSIDSPYGRQIDDLFAHRNLETPKAALIEVQVLGGGLVAAYATLVDGITTDATYLAANLAAKRE